MSHIVVPIVPPDREAVRYRSALVAVRAKLSSLGAVIAATIAQIDQEIFLDAPSADIHERPTSPRPLSDLDGIGSNDEDEESAGDITHVEFPGPGGR